MAKFVIEIRDLELVETLKSLEAKPGLEALLARGSRDYLYRKNRAAGVRSDANAWKKLSPEVRAKLIAQYSLDAK